MALTADGSSVVVVKRSQDAATLLKAAGIERAAGDVLVQSQGELKVERAVPVVVQVDGSTLAWRTRATTVKGLVSELGLEVSPYDSILYEGVPVGLNDNLTPRELGAASLAALGVFNRGLAVPEGIVLSVQRAVPLTIVEDGRAINLRSTQPTLEAALREAGIQLGPADEVFPPPTMELAAGMQGEVKHAKAVKLVTGGSTRTIYTQQEKLKDALVEAGLALGADDRVEPSIEAAVANGMTARLVRVAGRQFSERETLVRKTVFKPDENLTGSASRIVKGHDGVRLREYRVVIEDGIEREKKLVKESVETEVQDNVIFYAASTIRAAGISAGDFNASKTERVYATWYNAASAGRAAEDPNYGMTYSGVPVTRGIVAVDPKVIALGTRLFIPGYGLAVAADTGGGIVGNMIDLGFPDGAPVDWQTGWVEVYVLAP